MRYLVRKSAILLLTLFLVSLAVFFAFHVIPGDSAMLILGTEASEESLAALRHEMGRTGGSLPSIPAGSAAFSGGISAFRSSTPGASPTCWDPVSS